MAGLVHAPVLAALHQEVFTTPWAEKAIADLLRLPTVTAWVAGSSDPAGFIMTQAAADEMEILTIAVRPAHQRAGVGRTLIEVALKAAKENGAIKCHLEVADDNHGAKALYAALGFSESGLRPAYYVRDTGPVDAVLMAKNLMAEN